MWICALRRQGETDRRLPAISPEGFARAPDVSAYFLAPPLRRTVTQQEVGGTAAFLASHLAPGITGM